MATYGLYYYGGWHSKVNQNGVYEQGNICIDKLGYEGDPETFTIAADSLIIRYNFNDWNNPIMGLQAEFEIVNNKTDFFDLLPLLSAEEKEYKVRINSVTPKGAVLFEGYLNVQTGNTKYLKYQNLRLSASNYLYKLDDVHPVEIDTIQNLNFITIIQKILADTDGDFDIRVNSLLHAEGDLLSGTPAVQTLLNKNACNTEVFWTDNVERMSSLQILKAILTTFDCYIYWHDRYWYIERYEDIWQASIDYVVYQHNVDYLLPTDVGVTETIARATADVHDLVFMEQSQQIAIIPGLKTIKINLDDKRYTNLIDPEMKNITEVSADPPLPALRTWEYIDDADVTWVTTDAGKTKKIITNSVHRILLAALPTDLAKGIYTQFKLTVAADTQLNIQFKYVVNETTIANWANGTWKDFTFLFHWYLKVLPDENFIYKSNKPDDTNGKWYMAIGGTNENRQEFPVQGSDFDQSSSSCAVSISIPVGEIHKIADDIDTGFLIGDVNMMLCIGIESVKINDTAYRTCPTQAWIGDVVISTTGDNQENVIEGKVNTKFLGKKEIGLILYDCESYNYKNAILRGTDYLIRTEKWGTSNAALNIVQKGICWGPSENPVVAMAHTNDGTGNDAFISTMYGLNSSTTYYVRSYFIDANGSVIYGNQVAFGTDVLQVGQYYQGGLIAFFFEAGDIGYVAGEWHGVIIATQDQSRDSVWCYISVNPYGVGNWDSAVGYGKSNTDAMLAETTNVGLYAAKLCGDYESGIYHDWFLPSLEELKRIQAKKDIIKGFTNTAYWTSTEKQSAPKNAYFVMFNFPAGSSVCYESTHKHESLAVRACRYF